MMPGNWGVPFNLKGEESSAGGLPHSGRQGESLHKASSTEFDVAYIPQRGPVTAAHFPGSDYFETADHASLDLTGNIEIILWAAATDWTPAVNEILLSKMNSANLSPGGGYEVVFTTAGELVFAISDGASRLVMTSATHGLVDGQGFWLKFSYDNTAKTTSFFKSSQSLSTPLAQLKFTDIGTSAAHGGGSPTANAVVLRIAQRPPGGTGPMTGKMGRAVVKNASGTVVADWRGDAPIGGRFLDSAGRSWTATGAAWQWAIVE